MKEEASGEIGTLLTEWEGRDNTYFGFLSRGIFQADKAALLSKECTEF